MITVSCPKDPKSFAKFECLLDAEIYYEVARASLPPHMELVMMADSRVCTGCDKKCGRAREFEEQLN